MRLDLRAGRYAVCRLQPEDELPVWATGRFLSWTRSDRELSVVCDDDVVPSGVTAERGFRLLEVEGPLPFSLTGVLASLTTCLADASISIFALSTFDTDYLLVREEDVERARRALAAAGHEVVG